MPQQSIKVLLADDHAIVRAGILALLSSDTQIKVVGQCGNGLEVLPLVRETQPHVVVLDITMPGLNGLEACKLVKQEFPATPIIMLTMHSGEHYVSRADRCGASGYLLKEAAPGELIDAIRTVHKGGRYFPTHGHHQGG